MKTSRIRRALRRLARAFSFLGGDGKKTERYPYQIEKVWPRPMKGPSMRVFYEPFGYRSKDAEKTGD